MSQQTKTSSEVRAKRWAARLMKSVNAVLKRYPHADPDNVRHTLILLEKPPLERLGIALLRGRNLRDFHGFIQTPVQIGNNSKQI